MNGSDKVAVGTGSDAIITDELPDIVIQGLARERFMISTHPWVLNKSAVEARVVSVLRPTHGGKP